MGFVSSPSPPFLDDLCTQPTAEPQPHPCRGENGPRVTGGSSPGKPVPAFCPVRSFYIREGFPSYPVTDEFIWRLHLVGELTDPQQPHHTGCTSHSWATTHGLSPPHRPTNSAPGSTFYKCAQCRCYLWSSGGTLGLLKSEPLRALWCWPRCEVHHFPPGAPEAGSLGTGAVAWGLFQLSTACTNVKVPPICHSFHPGARWQLGVLLVHALCLLPRAWEGFTAPFYSFHKYSCHFSSSPRWVLSSSGALTLSCPCARTQLCSWKMSPCSDSP